MKQSIALLVVVLTLTTLTTVTVAMSSPSIIQDGRSSLNILAAVTGMNGSFYRQHTATLLGAHTIGDDEISFDKFSVNARELIGHEFTLDGNTYEFNTDVDADGSGVVTTIGITPALVTSPADNSAIVVTRTRTFYWSELEFSTGAGDTPADVIFEPLMELTGAAEFPLADGNGFGEGFKLPTAEITIYGRELSNDLRWGRDHRYLDKLEPYVWDGHAASLYVVAERVGDDSVVERLDWSTKITLLDGIVGSNRSSGNEPDAVWGVNELVIPVRSLGGGLVGEWQRALKGFGPCPYFPTSPTPDATIQAPAGVWDPGSDSFTVLISVYAADGQDHSAAHSVIDKSNGAGLQAVRLEQIPSGWFFVTQFTDASNATVTTAGSGFDFTSGVWFDVAVVMDRPSEQMRMYIDGVLIDTDTVAAAKIIKSTTTQTLCFGCESGPSSIVGGFVGQQCQVSIWDEVLSISEIRQYQSAPIPNANDATLYPNLLAYWPGIIDAGSPRTLRDIGPNSLSQFPSLWAGDLSSSVLIGDSHEGASTTIGTAINKGYGPIQNSQPTPANIDEKLRYYADPSVPTQAPHELYLNAVAQGAPRDYAIEDFHETTPGVGEFICCSRHSLLKAEADLDDQLLTVDYGGISTSDGGYRLRQAQSQHLQFATPPTVFNASYTLTFWLTMYDDSTNAQRILDCVTASDGFSFVYRNTGSTRNVLFWKQWGDAGGSDTLTSPKVEAGESHHFALVASEAGGGGDVTLTMYMDGVIADTGTITAEDLAHPSGVLSIGADVAGTDKFGDILLSEITTHNAAIDVDIIRDIMFRRTLRDDITAGPTAPTYAPNLINYWGHNPRSIQHATGALTDIMGADSTSTGTVGTWTAGCGIASTLRALHDLTRYGGATHDQIVVPVDSFTASMCQHPISYEAKAGTAQLISGGGSGPGGGGIGTGGSGGIGTTGPNGSGLNGISFPSIFANSSQRKLATVSGMIATIKAGAAAQVTYSPFDSSYHLLQFASPGVSIATLSQHEHFAGPLEVLPTELPIQKVVMRWGFVSRVQVGDAVDSTADATRVERISLEWRYVNDPDTLIADLLPGKSIEVVVSGVWLYESHATLAARLQKQYRSTTTPLPHAFIAPIVRSRLDDSSFVAGASITLSHEDIPGGVDRDVRILSIVTDARVSEILAWG